MPHSPKAITPPPLTLCAHHKKQWERFPQSAAYYWQHTLEHARAKAQARHWHEAIGTYGHAYECARWLAKTTQQYSAVQTLMYSALELIYAIRKSDATISVKAIQSLTQRTLKSTPFSKDLAFVEKQMRPIDDIATAPIKCADQWVNTIWAMADANRATKH